MGYGTWGRGPGEVAGIREPVPRNWVPNVARGVGRPCCAHGLFETSLPGSSRNCYTPICGSGLGVCKWCVRVGSPINLRQQWAVRLNVRHQRANNCNTPATTNPDSARSSSGTHAHVLAKLVSKRKNWNPFPPDPHCTKHRFTIQVYNTELKSKFTICNFLYYKPLICTYQFLRYKG